MSDTTKDIVGIFVLLGTIAIFTVVLRQSSQTPQVVGSIFGGFSQALSVAMGGSYSGTGLSSVY